MTSVFHTWSYGRFIEIQSNLRSKKLHRTSQGSDFLGGSFSNRDNIRAPIQFRRDGQLQHLKRWFFLENIPIHFHINTPVLLDRSNETSLVFSSIEINKPRPTSCPSPRYLLDQIQVQKPILVAATDQMPDHTTARITLDILEL